MPESQYRPVNDIRQARPYFRAVGLVLAELFSFGRHTIAQAILSLGQVDGDWSGWYRLFSRERFDEEQLNRILVRGTLGAVPETEPYVVGFDSTQISRSSLKMPGSCWLKSPRSPTFRAGIERGQRFLIGAWLTPLENGFSRAIPVRFMTAFPAKAIPAHEPTRREWEAGLAYLNWIRAQLDQAGRVKQRILALADGAFDVLELWRQLPERVSLITRTARNRALYWLPQPQSGPGRPASYGDKAPTRQIGYMPVYETGLNGKCWSGVNASRCVINC